MLLALDRYFNTYEKTTPDFVARVWLGDGYAGEHAFRGRTTERHQHRQSPWRGWLGRQGRRDLVLAKDGAGRLYYRIGMQLRAGEPRARRPPTTASRSSAATRASTRQRTCVATPTATWHIRPGRACACADDGGDRHGATTWRWWTRCPPGLEAMNPALAVTGTLPADGPQTVDRDGRPGWAARAVSATGGGGRGLVRAPEPARRARRGLHLAAVGGRLHATPTWRARPRRARFVVPPPKAEEMYSPETFGRGGTDRVVVE